MKNKKPLKRLLVLFPKKWMLVTGVLVTIMISVLQVSFSYMLMRVIDSAVMQDYTLFFHNFITLFVMVLLTVLMSFLRTRSLGGYTERGLAKLRSSYGRKTMDISVGAMQKTHSGELISRGTNDMSRIRQFTAQTLPRMIEIPLSATLALILLFILSWRLSLIALAMIPVLVVGSSLLSKPIGPASKRVQKKLGNVNTVVTDFIKGIEVAKAYNLEKPLEAKNHDYVAQSVDSGIELAKRRSILEAFSMIISIMPFVATFLIGGYFVIEGFMSVGALLAFINLLNLLTFPLSQMAIIIGEAKRDMAAAERVFEVMDEQEERKDGNTYAIIQNHIMIQLDELSFSYNGDEHTVINNLALTIENGKTIAFVGPSGGGKSTLAKLLMGFYDNYTGSIKVGGYEIKDWQLDAMRSNMALVSQDTFLFPESIKENIAHGKEDANEAEILAAAKKANAHDFIMELPQGYDTILSELGNSLSGGQRQRLSIARAILKDAPILILDEATSALDNESEALIQEALAPMIKNKTTIIIAHRLSTIKDADEICVIEAGAIHEKGTHETLLKASGTYASLYQHQCQQPGGDYREEANL